MIMVIIISIMLGMGCVTEVSQLRENLRRPWGILIALLTQFFITPLVGFVLIVATKMETLYAIGTIIMASCPGGVFSNNFSYLTFGDVSLSVCLTTCSSVFAIAGLPMTLALYGRAWVDGNGAISVPFKDIGLSLIMIIVPAAVGILIRWKLPRPANVIEKICQVIGSLGLVAWIIMKSVLSSEIFIAPYQTYVIAAVLPVVSFSIGFLFSTLFRLPADKRRSVAIETGCQNVGLALAVIAISFEGHAYLNKIQTVPILYGLFMVSFAVISIATYRLFLWKQKSTCDDSRDDEDALIDDDRKLVPNPDNINNTYGSVVNDPKSPADLDVLPVESKERSD
ncbi:ileal sodium/bile acid cotransporter-like isoform X2 [Ptychodera flava]